MERRTFTFVLRRDQDNISWGFRLQGGVNFAAPLTVQSVQPNSIAAQAGLMAGDGVLKINGKNADLMEHEEAKEEIVKSGNELTFFVQRATTVTWSPRVPVGPDQATGVGNTDPTAGISRISLAVNRPAGTQGIGSSYNRVPKPFGAPSVAPAGPAIVVGPADQRGPPALSTAPTATTLLPLSGGGRPPPAAVQPGNPGIAVTTAALKPNAVSAPPANIVVGRYDDDPLPPPPPPLNGAMGLTSPPAMASAGMPLLRGVSAAAATAAADRAARLAADRSIAPASRGLTVTVDAAGGRASPAATGRPVSPQSLSPSYPNKVSHVRSRSAELLQQYLEAAESEQVQPLSDAQIQQQKSAVLLALEQEEEFKKRGAAADAGRRPSADAVEEEPQLYKGSAVKSRAFRLLEQEIERGSEVKSCLSPPAPAAAAPAAPAGFRSVTAPQSKADGKSSKDATDNGALTDTGPMHCYACGGLISGVFAKVRGRPIHSDCIRCCRCRMVLKTAGYFIVNENMYCEQHAKEATRPAAGGYTAYVVDAPNGDY